jgi:CheY-like chemotaxis protein
MTVTAKRILVVANEKPLRETRTMLVESEGYSVVSVCSDEDAFSLLETECFDLILIGRNTESPVPLDERLRTKYPDLLILKIDHFASAYPSRITDAVPTHVLDALREMLA